MKKNDKAFTEEEIKEFLAKLWSCGACGKKLYSSEALDKHLLKCEEYKHQERVSKLLYEYTEFEIPRYEVFELLLRKWMKDPQYKVRKKPDLKNCKKSWEVLA